jgi:hypothetical protein
MRGKGKREGGGNLAGIHLPASSDKWLPPPQWRFTMAPRPVHSTAARSPARGTRAPARGSATVPPASTRDGLLRQPPSSSASPHAALLGESERHRVEKVRARVSALALRAVLFGRTWRAVVGSHPMARSCSRAQGRDREAVHRLLGSAHLATRVRFDLPARFPLTERQEKKGPSGLYDFFFPVTVLCFIFWK